MMKTTTTAAMRREAAAPSLTSRRSAALSSRVAGRRSLRSAAIDPSKTAVVLIEYQNEFTSEGGKLHDAVKGVMESSNMMSNTKEVVEKARAKGCKIVHAPITFSDDYKELSDNIFGILANVKEGGCFKASEWGGKICDELAPQDGDVVIEGKRGLDGFMSTNLDFVLRQNSIENIALGGFLTNCCVESTMRTAYEKGYNVVTLTDCTAACSEEEQKASVDKTYPMFSKPMTSAEFVESL